MSAVSRNRLGEVSEPWTPGSPPSEWARGVPEAHYSLHPVVSGHQMAPHAGDLGNRALPPKGNQGRLEFSGALPSRAVALQDAGKMAVLSDHAEGRCGTLHETARFSAYPPDSCH